MGQFTDFALSVSKQQAPIQPAKERGVLGDLGSDLLRGGADALSLTGHAIQTLDGDQDNKGITDKIGNSIASWAEGKQKTSNWLKPDESEVAGTENGLYSKVREGVRSIPTSLAPLAVGAAGSLAGGPVVGGAAGLATLGGLFGLGTYDQTRQRIREENPAVSDKDAHSAALKYAAVESVGELVSDAIAIATGGVGKVFTSAGKQTVNQSIKQLMKISPKKAAKDMLLKTYPGELATEAAQGKLQSDIEQDVGIGQSMGALESLWEVAIPTAVMTLALGSATNGYSAYSRNKLLKELNSEDQDRRVTAARIVNGELKKQDKEVATAWRTNAAHQIKLGQPIEIDEELSSTVASYNEFDKARIKDFKQNLYGKQYQATDKTDNIQERQAQRDENAAFDQQFEATLAKVKARNNTGNVPEQQKQFDHTKQVERNRNDLQVQQEEFNAGYAQGNNDNGFIEQGQQRFDNRLDFEANRTGKITPKTSVLAQGAATSKGARIEQEADYQSLFNTPQEPQPFVKRDNLPVTADSSLMAQGRFTDKQQLEQDELDALDALEQRDINREKEYAKTFQDLIPPSLQPKIALVEQRLAQGEVGHRFQKDDGTWDGVKSTNPDWLRTGALKEIGKDGIRIVINNVRKGKKLTTRQQFHWNKIKKVAEWEWDNDPSTTIARESERIEKEEGIPLSNPQETPVGNLNTGDKVVVQDAQGMPDVVTHKGYDDKGQAILKDGVTIHADPWDTVESLGIKKSGNQDAIQENPDTAVEARRVIENKQDGQNQPSPRAKDITGNLNRGVRDTGIRGRVGVDSTYLEPKQGESAVDYLERVKRGNAPPVEPAFEAPQSEWDKYEADYDAFYGKEDLTPRLTQTKSIEQQKTERRQEKADSLKTDRDKLSIPILRAIKREAEWQFLEENGVPGQGTYPDKQADTDATALVTYGKNSTRKQIEAMGRIKQDEYEQAKSNPELLDIIKRTKERDTQPQISSEQGIAEGSTEASPQNPLSAGAEVDFNKPWTVTRKEWINGSLDPEDLNGISIDDAYATLDRWKKTNGNNESPASEIALLQRYDAMHKSMVAKAFYEGKPVPVEVLADYPELSPTPKSKVSETQNKTEAHGLDGGLGEVIQKGHYIKHKSSGARTGKSDWIEVVGVNGDKVSLYGVRYQPSINDITDVKTKLLRGEVLVEDGQLVKTQSRKETTQPQPDSATSTEKVGGESSNGQGKEIEDVGEKLGGAKKDLARALTKDLTDDEISTKPLSKTWPKPNIDDLDNSFSSAFAVAARNEIPRKPVAKYKKKQWIEKVKLMRGFTEKVLSGSVTESRIREKAKDYRLEGFFFKVDMLMKMDKSLWDKVSNVFDFSDAYRYAEDGTKEQVPGVQVNGRTFNFKENIDEVIPDVEKFLRGAQTGPKSMKFEVRMVRATGKYFINKKGDGAYTHLKEFDDSKSARDFINNNNAELVGLWEKHKAENNIHKKDIRNKTNRPRVGADHRGDKDVTPETFMETFGFRGVEFGNWVKQGKNRNERQGMINAAYDALYDLANIVGVSPKAISLNGTLGLGFGSRGSGSAMAHYEPGKLVINLTKTKGAGTFAHEWFHALDNYFQRKRETGKTKREDLFVTYSPEVYYRNGDYTLTETRFNKFVKGKNGKGYTDPTQWEKKEGIRPEVLQQFASVVETLDGIDMKKRSQAIDKGKVDGYWGRIIERAARSFESYVIAKMDKEGYHNDYLANVKPYDEFAKNKGRYPYPTHEEISSVEEAFDGLFKTIKTRKTEKGVELYSKSKSTTISTPANVKQELRAKLGNKLNRLLKGTVNIIDTEQVDDIIAKWDREDAGKYSINLYHGSRQQAIDGLLRPSKEGDLGAGVYLTPRKRFASSFTTLLNFGVKGEDALKREPGKVFKVTFDPKGKKILAGETKLTEAELDYWENDGSDPRGEGISTHDELIDAENGRNSFGGSWSQSLAWDKFLEKFGYDAVYDGAYQFMVRDPSSLDTPIQAADSDPAVFDVKYSKGGQIQGFTTPDGKVYLVEGGIEQGQAMSVLAHELGIHAKQAGFKSEKAFQGILRSIERNTGKNTKLGKLLQEASEQVPDDTNSADILEEQLSYLVENHPDTSIVRRFVALVKKWMVENVGISADIFSAADFHALAMAAIDRSAGVSTGERVKRSVRDKFKAVDTKSKAFRDWFGDSKVVDDRGEPLVVYHGTFGVFEDFSVEGTEGGIFFTPSHDVASTFANAEEYGQDPDDVNPNVIPAYLALRNPSIIEAKEVYDKDGFHSFEHMRKALENAKAKGHDGAILKGVTDAGLIEDQYVAFNPTQIKSAISNTGDFSKTDPRIKYSKAQEKTVKQYNKDQAETIKQFSKPDIRAGETIIKTPEYILSQDPTGQQMLDAALNRRELKFQYENNIMDGITEADREDPDAFEKKRGAFARFMEGLKKKAKGTYTRSNKWLLDADRTGKRFRLQYFKGYEVVDPNGELIGQVAKKSDADWVIHNHHKKHHKGKTDVRLKDYGTSDKVELWTVEHVTPQKDGKPKVAQYGTFSDEHEAVTHMVKSEAQMMRDQGHTEQGAEAVIRFRNVMNRGFDVMIADMRRIIQEAEENGQDEPSIDYMDETRRWGVFDKKNDRIGEYASQEEAKLFAEPLGLKVKKQSDNDIKKTITYSTAIAEMGDLRGSYFPRQREQGGVALIATNAKTGDKIRENFDFHLIDKDKIDPETGEIVDTPKRKWMIKGFNKVTGRIPFIPTLEKRRKELKAKGYEVEAVRNDKMSESVFEAAQLGAAINAILEEGLNSKTGSGDLRMDEAYRELNKLLSYSVADIFKQRGYLSSRLRRNSEYWRGFEEDMSKAAVQYSRGLAAGMAKRKTAQDLTLLVTGRDVPWSAFKADGGTREEYNAEVKRKAIDPKKQGNLYTEVMSWMKDILRNDEQADRVLGTLKGLAVMKFLSFRVSSAAVNATNLMQAVPATISSHSGGTVAGALKEVGQSIVALKRYRKGQGSSLDKKVFTDIAIRGWDEAQFNHESANVLRSKAGEKYSKFVDLGMSMFGWVEKVNRATTIHAAYKQFQAKHPDKAQDHEWLMKKAKTVSDRAHGVYGKETAPVFTRGKANPLKLTNTFMKFSHNYVLNTLEMFGAGKNKQAAYMLLSPMLLGGAGASVVTPALSSVLSAMGFGDDPEEEMYQWAENNFGSDSLLRHGLPGLLGMNFKGSLQMNNPVPSRIEEVFGAPGSLWFDFRDAYQHLKRGEVGKAIEKTLPTGLGSPLKALREYSDGVTTGSYSRVYFGQEPLKASGLDATLRFFSFNPSSLSGKREKQWRERKVAQKYAKMKQSIGSRLKKMWIKSNGNLTRSQWLEIVAEIDHYNSVAMGLRRPDVTIIKKSTVKSWIRNVNRAPKRERQRVVNY